MNKFEAAKILNVSGDLTKEIIKKAYKKACSKYHPDRNPAGLEMMKAVNSAFEALKNFVGRIDLDNEATNENGENIDLGEKLNDILNQIINLEGISIEICGSWIWVSGDTKQHKELLKKLSFKWASKKKQWYFSNGVRSKGRGKFSMDDIREYHGSQSVKGSANKSAKYRKIAA